MDRLPHDSYYALTRRMYAAIGQWPFLSRREMLVRRFFVCFVLTLYMITNVSAVVTSDFDQDVIITDLPLFWSAFLGVIVYFVFYKNTGKCEYLFLRIRDDWRSFHTRREIDLKLEYANFASKFTQYAMAYFIFVTATFFSFTTVIAVYGKVAKGREIDPRKFFVRMEIFLDCRTFGLPALFFLYLSLFTLFFSVVSNGTVYLLLVQHACGMFHVVGRRLEQAVAVFKRDDEEFSERERAMLLNFVIRCSSKHRETLKFASVVESYYAVPTFICLAGYVFSLAVTVIQSTENMRIEALIHLASQVVFVFATNAMGQYYMDASTSIAARVYDSTWYDAPARVQKLFVLIMARSQKPNVLSAANMFVLSIENFRSIVSSAMSYYMFYRNVR